MRKVILISVIFSFALAGNILAHQPRIVSEGRIVQINNPEISQAFYGELKGKAVDFEIDSGQPFKFYVGLLVPDLPILKKTFLPEFFRRKEGIKKICSFSMEKIMNGPIFMKSLPVMLIIKGLR